MKELTRHDFAAAHQQAQANGNGKPAKPTEPTAVDLLETVRLQADGLLAPGCTIPPSDRLIHLRELARELGLSLRDQELSQIIWQARRRRAGAVEVVRRGMKLSAAPAPWLWDGVLMAQTSNLLVALPKVGKTSLLLAALAAWRRGERHYLGREFHGPCPPVILAGTDMPEADWRRMLGRVGLVAPDGSVQAPIEALFHAGCPLHLDEQGIGQLADLARELPGALLVIDSYAKCTASLELREASPEFAGPLGDLQEAVAPYGVTLAVIHHSSHSRAGEGAVAACRGTTALPAAASQIVALSWLSRSKGSADRRVVLQTEGRAGEPLQLLIEQQEAGWLCHGDAAEAFREQEREQAEAELHDRQAAALEIVRERWAKGERTASGDLIEALELRGASAAPIARRTLQQLTRRGLLESRKESTGKGQIVWFWPAGEGGDNTPPVLSVPPVRGVRPVPSPAPLNPEITGAGREGTPRTHGTDGTENREREHLPVPSSAEPVPDWLPRLLELRQQRPSDPPATLALALDPDGTGRPTGREVRAWLERITPPTAA